METFWFFRLRFRRAYDSAYDSDFRFSLGHKLSYDSDYDSDSDYVASENQPLTMSAWRVKRDTTQRYWSGLISRRLDVELNIAQIPVLTPMSMPIVIFT